MRILLCKNLYMIIEVFTKQKFSQNENERLLKKFLPYSNEIKIVRQNKLYLIEGDYSLAEAKKIAEEVLIDPIVENYIIFKKNFSDKFISSFSIWFKEGITDVVAESVIEAIVNSGFKKPQKVKTGKIIHFYPKPKDLNRLEKAVREIFVNDLIHKLEVY